MLKIFGLIILFEGETAAICNIEIIVEKHNGRFQNLRTFDVRARIYGCCISGNDFLLLIVQRKHEFKICCLVVFICNKMESFLI